MTVGRPLFDIYILHDYLIELPEEYLIIFLLYLDFKFQIKRIDIHFNCIHLILQEDNCLRKMCFPTVSDVRKYLYDA